MIYERIVSIFLIVLLSALMFKQCGKQNDMSRSIRDLNSTLRTCQSSIDSFDKEVRALELDNLELLTKIEDYKQDINTQNRQITNLVQINSKLRHSSTTPSTIVKDSLIYLTDTLTVPQYLSPIYACAFEDEHITYYVEADSAECRVEISAHSKLTIITSEDKDNVYVSVHEDNPNIELSVKAFTHKKKKKSFFNCLTSLFRK